MKFDDYSPPPDPSLGQQRDALKKGLGRVVQWASQGRLDDEPLLAACLRDQRFDGQVEGPRGDWLWDAIQAAGAADRLRAPILHALYDFSEDHGTSQLCQLAGHYAATGDSTFRVRLYEIVERKPIADSGWLGEDEIVSVDGEAAFVFAARVRGRALATRDWDWDDRRLVEQAIERFGESRVEPLLSQSTEEALNRFREGWDRVKRQQAGREPIASHQDRMRAISVGEIIRAAESRNSGFGSYQYRGWGMYADPTDLAVILQHLWGAREPAVIANLLKAFSNRALPVFDDRLIELARHPDADVRRAAFDALEKNAYPLVREFALNELANGVDDGSPVGLFINNYVRGDERRLLEVIELPPDENELHWLLMDVVKVLEKNPEADCSRLGVIAYALTPCENCRVSAAELLADRQSAPDWLTEECRHDSTEDCRKPFEKQGNRTNNSPGIPGSGRGSGPEIGLKNDPKNGETLEFLANLNAIALV